MRILALIVVLLAGCGVSTDDHNSTCRDHYSTFSVAVGESGLVLEPSSAMFVTFQQIEQFYIETEACLGIVAPGPMVTFFSFKLHDIPAYSGMWGLTQEGLSQVSINTDSPGDRRDCKFDEWTLRHEFVHHLLNFSGFSPEDNGAHLTPLFGLCGVAA